MTEYNCALARTRVTAPCPGFVSDDSPEDIMIGAIALCPGSCLFTYCTIAHKIVQLSFLSISSQCPDATTSSSSWTASTPLRSKRSKTRYKPQDWRPLTAPDLAASLVGGSNIILALPFQRAVFNSQTSWHHFIISPKSLAHQSIRLTRYKASFGWKFQHRLPPVLIK